MVKHPKNNPSSAATNVNLALLRYYDEFAAFSDDCAFLCDAFSSLAASEGERDPTSVRGMQRQAQWLKERVIELKRELGRIRELQNHP